MPRQKPRARANPLVGARAPKEGANSTSRYRLALAALVLESTKTRKLDTRRKIRRWEHCVHGYRMLNDAQDARLVVVRASRSIEFDEARSWTGWLNRLDASSTRAYRPQAGDRLVNH